MFPIDRDDSSPPASSTGQQMVDVAACSTRLQLLLLLAVEGPQDVLQVATRSGQSQPLVSSHLKALLRLGLCVYEIEGRRHVYRLADPRTVRLGEFGVEFFLEGKDGSTLRWMMPFSSPDYRLIALPPRVSGAHSAIEGKTTPSSSGQSQGAIDPNKVMDAPRMEIERAIAARASSNPHAPSHRVVSLKTRAPDHS